ncbi:MAG: LrgB family protein [Clostridia bacterium]|nr:LrgB family protein [Clostridia bacterium]
MLNETLSSLSYFGIFLTGAVYVLAVWLQKKTRLSILNPLLVSCVAIMILLLVTGIDYSVYQYGKLNADGSHDGTGAVFFQNLLTPTTVCLAIPLYEKLSYLKKYPLAIFGGILSGTAACLTSILGLSVAFNLTHEQYVTLLPKSITTAIGMGVSEELGGLVSVTIASIIVTGIFGNVTAGWILRLFRINHPVAMGLACGTAAHAMGTSRARDFGSIQEAMSGLSIAVCGLLTVVLASVFAMIQW